MPKYNQSVLPQPGSLKVVELFETVQGEGFYIGVPSVFFRTGMCNLECAGCDTKWDDWAETSIDESARKIAAFPSTHVVFTGGEPTLWQEGLAVLMAQLDRIKPGLNFTVESNGSVPIRNTSLLARVDLWSFSPKVGSLGFTEKFSKDVVLENISETCSVGFGGVQIKYVLDPNVQEHVDSVFAFQDSVDALPGPGDNFIYFQPYDRGTLVNIYARQVAFNPANEYNEDLAKLTKLVMERSGSRFRVVPQLHKFITYR